MLAREVKPGQKIVFRAGTVLTLSTKSGSSQVTAFNRPYKFMKKNRKSVWFKTETGGTYYVPLDTEVELYVKPEAVAYNFYQPDVNGADGKPLTTKVQLRDLAELSKSRDLRPARKTRIIHS